MKYLRIKNNGLIDPLALTLVGASTKRNDETKIGQFGSGNKFAMAYLIRNGYEVQIYAGKRNIAIETVDETFRGIDFKIIKIDGRETSITTEMGKDWTLWQALREIYCNAIDEGGYDISLVNNIEPQEGETHYYISNSPEIFNFIVNFDNYFATNKKVLFENSIGRILVKTGSKCNIYRRGVRCYETEVDSIYDYDFNSIEIDENRLVKYNWEVPNLVWQLIYQCTDQEVIMNVLHQTASGNFIESDLNDWHNYNSTAMSECFKYCITSNNLVPENQTGLLEAEERNQFLVIPSPIYKSIRGFLKEINVGRRFNTVNNEAYREVSPDGFQKETLQKAVDYLGSVAYKIDYEISVCIFESEKTLGMATDKKILIAKKCLDMGVKETINTIIEENTHLKYNVEDRTRAMQTALIDELLLYMSRINVLTV